MNGAWTNAICNVPARLMYNVVAVMNVRPDATVVPPVVDMAHQVSSVWALNK